MAPAVHRLLSLLSRDSMWPQMNTSALRPLAAAVVRGLRMLRHEARRLELPCLIELRDSNSKVLCSSVIEPNRPELVVTFAMRWMDALIDALIDNAPAAFPLVVAMTDRHGRRVQRRIDAPTSEEKPN